jgi:hypothetical protein
MRLGDRPEDARPEHVAHRGVVCEQILAKGKILPRLHRVAVVVGKPVTPPPVEGRSRRTAATRMTAELALELQRCFTEAQRLAN